MLMIPYNLPNLSIRKVALALFLKDKDEAIKYYFRKITGKKYILITNSARSALYLAYKSIAKNGNIVTSPLTCISAVDPIIYSENQPNFVDILSNTLNIDTRLIESSINENTIAIQVIHFGGIPVDMENIIEIALRHGITIIEDCAQALGAKYKNEPVGSFGEISCFSQIKNAYGIGGGILATNNHKIYKNAKIFQNKFKKVSNRLLVYRILRNIIETKRVSFVGNIIYNLLMSSGNILRHKIYKDEYQEMKKSLKRPSKIYSKIFYVQLKYINEYHEKRKSIGNFIIKKLQNLSIISNYKDLSSVTPSFTKLYIHSEKFDAKKHIKILNILGIEAKHLEHKFFSYYQERFDKNEKTRNFFSAEKCKNYLTIHDQILSLPIHEKLSEKKISEMIAVVQDIITHDKK